MLPHPFLRLNSANTEDMLADAAVHVLAERGATGLSIKAVAEWLRVTPQRVSQHVSRDRLAFVVTARIAERWIEWIEFRRWVEGVLALLPAEEEEIAGVRVWLTLSELARSDAEVAEILRATRLREEAVVRERLGANTGRHELGMVMAMVDGLRVGLCEPGGTLTLTEARSSLTHFLELLGQSSAAARPA